MNDCIKDMNLPATDSVASIPPLVGDDEDGYPAEPPGAPPLPLCQDGNPMYKYRDFGHIDENAEGASNSDVPAPTQSNRGGSESSIRVQKFPVKLYAILAQKEFHDIICWMPHGRSWKVLKPSMFESLVMPLFFEYSNYHSFNRLVNAWSFRRISTGPDRGSYYHELFLRGKPHLQNYMRRLPKTHKKLPMKKKNEPDFYKLDQANPLPAICDAPIPGAAATVQAMRAGVPPPQSTSSHSDMLPMNTPMTQQSHLDMCVGNPMIITPNMSPNHAGPSIIGDNFHSSSNHSTGGMNGIGSSMHGFGNMSSMGNGNMGMSSMGSIPNDNMGMGGMSSMNNMNNMNGMGLSGMTSMGNMASGSMGGMNGSSSLGMNQNYMMSSSNLNMYGGQSNAGNSFNPRYSSYNDNIGDMFDDFDCTLSPSMTGNGGSSMRSHQPQHMGAMMSHDFIDTYGYDKMGTSMPNNIRRPIAVRQGSNMDQMSGLRGSCSPSHLRQSDGYYSGYSQQSNMMMSGSLNGMQGQSDVYSRSGSSSLPSLQDEYVPSQDPSTSNCSNESSSNIPIRTSEH